MTKIFLSIIFILLGVYVDMPLWLGRLCISFGIINAVVAIIGFVIDVRTIMINSRIDK